MTAAEIIAEMQADIDFLLLRCKSAGSVSFTSDRWTGTSSNALVALAYGGTQDAMPSDRGDYAACVRTYHRLPRHRKTSAVREGLRRAKEAYLDRYPEDRYPATRAAAKAERERRANRLVRAQPTLWRRGRRSRPKNKIPKEPPMDKREPDMVMVPRDQLETLKRSIALGSLLPGEGEALIECWVRAAAHPPSVGEGVRERVAEAVHAGRFPPDRAPTPFAAEDRDGRDYCYRIADAILSALRPDAGGA